MTWRDYNSAEELMKAINNPDVKIEGNQPLVEASKQSLAHPSEPPFDSTQGRKPHKYHVAAKEDRTYNRIVFHSKKEAEYAQSLDLRVKAGEIDFWLRQVPFTLPGPSVYRLDFLTFKKVSCYWAIQYIEVKGRDLPMGKLKRKQVEEIYGIKIEVV